MRYALITGGIVVNVAEASSPDPFVGSYDSVVQVDSVPDVGPGYSYDGATFTSLRSNLPIEAAKRLRFDEIDVRTNQILYQGFPYSGLVFPLSQIAQLNYVAMYAAADLIAPTAYPTYGDEGVFPLNTATDIRTFVAAAIAYVKSVQEGGTILKMQITALTTTSDVLAWVDSR